MSRSSKDKRQTNEPRHQTEVRPTESEDSDLVAAIVQHARAEFFAGPLPRPDMLRGYDEVVPGSAERIVTMAEVQAAHRRDIETQEALLRLYESAENRVDPRLIAAALRSEELQDVFVEADRNPLLRRRHNEVCLLIPVVRNSEPTVLGEGV